MNEREYDEYQLQQRQKIAMQTLLLTLVLILADGIVRTGWGEWAEPMMEALLLIVLPALYFLTLAICKNAYFGRSGSWLSWVYLALGALFGGNSSSPGPPGGSPLSKTASSPSRSSRW